MTVQRLFVSVLLCLILSLPALAQTATAELSGNVTDASGALVANAKVTDNQCRDGDIAGNEDRPDRRLRLHAPATGSLQPVGGSERFPQDDPK